MLVPWNRRSCIACKKKASQQIDLPVRTCRLKLSSTLANGHATTCTITARYNATLTADSILKQCRVQSVRTWLGTQGARAAPLSLQGLKEKDRDDSEGPRRADCVLNYY